MGIMDRDYYGEGGNRGEGAIWSGWGVAAWIIAVSCVVFFLQQVGKDRDGSWIEVWGRYDSSKVLSGELWRVATALLLHESLWQLVANMLLVYWAGSRLAQIHGQWEYLTYYVVSGVLGYGIVTGLSAVGWGDGTAMGANGSAVATLVLFARHFPRQQVLLFFILPLPVWGVAALYVGLDMLGVLGSGSRASVAAMDLSGAVFGYLYYQFQWQLTGGWQRRGGRRGRAPVRPSLRVAAPTSSDSVPVESSSPASAFRGSPQRVSTDFEAEVDRVLAKVSQQGQESLTAEERAILFQASEIYKKRRR